MEPDSEQPFRFGDVWTFNITSLEQPPDVDTDDIGASPQQELRWYASGFRDVNQGTGTVSYMNFRQIPLYRKIGGLSSF